MQIANRFTRAWLALAVPLLAVACSKGETTIPEAEILGYVPADTPYVFAALETAPDEVADKMGENATRIVKAYATVLKAALNEPPAEGQEPVLQPEERKRVSAILEELAAMVTPEGVPEAGIDRHSQMALYGVGLLPVLRVTLSDAAKFEAFLKRMEERAGKAMSVGSIDGHAYRYAGGESAKVILAVLEDQLVATFVPAALPEDLMKRVLGLTLPESSIADTDELAALAKKYGFTAYGLGLVDVQRIAATFLDQQSGVNESLLALMEHDRSELSDVCRDEIRAVAGLVPRVVTGYTEMTAEQIRSNSVFELRSDIAAGLQTITAPVPGLGQPHDALFSFGMSFDLPALRDFYAARLDAMEADPFECELFADLQDGVAKSRQALQQPVPPFVNDFHGFLAVIDDIQGLDIATRQPPTDIDMRFLISAANAPSLLAMGAMFSPQLASLDVKPDATPVRIELPPTGSPITSAWIAMSNDGIALAVGDGMETGLADMLSAASTEPSPFVSMDVDAARYYGFLGDVLESSQVGDDGERRASPETAAATGNLMRSLESMFDRITVDVQFTPQGIEMPSTMVLAK